MKRIFFFAWLALSVISTRAASPSFGDFLTNQFSVTGNKVALRNGAVVTNLTINNFVANGITYKFPSTNCLDAQWLAVAHTGTNELTFYCTNIFAPNIVVNTIEDLVATPVPDPGINYIGRVLDQGRYGDLAYLPNSTATTNDFNYYASSEGPGQWVRFPYSADIRLSHGAVTGFDPTNSTLIKALTIQSTNGFGQVLVSGNLSFLATSPVPLLNNNKIYFEEGSQVTGLSFSGNSKTNIALYGPQFVAAVGSTAVPALSLTNCLAVVLQSANFTGYTGETIHTSGVNTINGFSFGAGGLTLLSGNAATNFFLSATSGYAGAGTKALFDDGTFKVPSGGGGGSVANPTGTIGLTAVNGTSTNAIRSDGAPPLSQAIVPTWTGKHIWSQDAVNVTNAVLRNSHVDIGDEFPTISLRFELFDFSDVYDAGSITASRGGAIGIPEYDISQLKFSVRSGGVSTHVMTMAPGQTLTQGYVVASTGFGYGTGVEIRSGNNDPEGVIAAYPGSVFQRANGGAGTSLYVKEGGSSSANGWVAVTTASGGSGITGSGTANKVMKWLSSTVAGDSGITETNSNIGIGTAVPLAKLDVVSGSTEGIRIATTDDGPFAFMINNNTFGTTDAKGWGFFQRNDGSAGMYLNNTASIDLGTNGYLGVKTVGTPLLSALSVNGGISAGTYFGDAAPTNGMIISGKVGIGTNAPTEQLHVVGNGIVSGSVTAGSFNNNLSAFNATTSAQLYGVLSNETGSGTGALAMFSLNPSVTGGATVGGGIDFLEPADNGTSFVKLKAPNTNLSASYTNTLQEATGVIPLAPFAVILAGPTAARTYTFPDAAATMAITSAGQTFTGNQVVNGTISVPGVGTNSERFGSGATSPEDEAVVVGNGATGSLSAYAAQAYGGQPVSIGFQAIGSGVSVGYKASATNYEAIAIGPQAKAGGLATIAIGDAARALPTGSFGNEIVMGDVSWATGNVNYFVGGGAGTARDFVSCWGCQGSSIAYDKEVATADHQGFLGWYQHDSSSFSAGQGLYNDWWIGGPVQASAPHAITLNFTSGLGSNIAGVPVTLVASKGTGTGVPGDFIFQTADLQSSGSTLQTATTKVTIKGGNPGTILDVTSSSDGSNGTGSGIKVTDSRTSGSYRSAGYTAVNNLVSASFLTMVSSSFTPFNSIDGAYLMSRSSGYPLGFTVNNGGTEINALHIKSTGLIGVGTTGPDRALEVNSATGINLRLTYNDSNGTAANYADFQTTSGGNLTITPSGGLIQIGGNTASFPAVQRSTEYVNIVDAAGGNTSGLMINSGTPILGVLSATATLDFGNILAAASADLTITVTGAAVGDSVHMGLPAAPNASITFNAFVSAADTVTIRSFNIGAIAVDQASATFRATVMKF